MWSRDAGRATRRSSKTLRSIIDAKSRAFVGERDLVLSFPPAGGLTGRNSKGVRKHPGFSLMTSPYGNNILDVRDLSSHAREVADDMSDVDGGDDGEHGDEYTSEDADLEVRIATLTKEISEMQRFRQDLSESDMLELGALKNTLVSKLLSGLQASSNSGGGKLVSADGSEGTLHQAVYGSYNKRLSMAERKWNFVSADLLHFLCRPHVARVRHSRAYVPLPSSGLCVCVCVCVCVRGRAFVCVVPQLCRGSYQASQMGASAASELFHRVRQQGYAIHRARLGHLIVGYTLGLTAHADIGFELVTFARVIDGLVSFRSSLPPAISAACNGPRTISLRTLSSSLNSLTPSCVLHTSFQPEATIGERLRCAVKELEWSSSGQNCDGRIIPGCFTTKKKGCKDDSMSVRQVVEPVAAFLAYAPLSRMYLRATGRSGPPRLMQLVVSDLVDGGSINDIVPALYEKWR